MISASQKTINSNISCNGIGLHSGNIVSLKLIPSPCNSGIVFKRSDLEEGKNIIKASYKNVVDTNLGTTLSNEFGAKISTIEHLMAALWGCGIDNVIVEINGPEIPIMDGSSEPFIFLIECAGINVQEEPRKVIEIIKNIRVEDGDKFIEIEPSKKFSIDLSVDFNHKHAPRQKFDYHSDLTSFKNDICRARTFAFQSEIDHLKKIGLIKGGSLDNAVVMGEDGVLNQEGLRYENELVRHKTLDFIGDIYLAGFYIIGHFIGSKTGHGINNKILKKLFESEDSWRLV